MLEEIRQQFFRRQGMMVSALVIFCLVVLFANLGQKAFWEPDEGRYAEISREMVESGDWLTPRLNYIKHFDKPPLTYWLIGSSFKLFGRNEFAGHLPLVLVGLGGVLAAFLLGQTLFGNRSGFLAAVILASSLGYPALARVLSTDIVFSFFCLLSYLFFVRKHYPLFYSSLALGFMTKGPVVFIIVLVPICAYLISEKQTHQFKQMRLAPGLALFAAVALPWFIYQITINRGLFHDWVIQHTLNRVVRETKQPFYFFLPVLIGLFFPWVFFAPLAFRDKRLFKKAGLLLFWFALPFIFFSSIGKKLVPYILPLLAPLAIITARAWDQAMDKPKILAGKMFKVCYYTFLSALGIFLIGAIGFLCRWFDYKPDLEAARLNTIILCVIVVGTIAISLFFFKLKKPGRLFATIAISSALLFLTAIDVLPKIEVNIAKSVKPLALEIKKDLRPQDLVVNYRCFLKSLPFYLARRTIVVERERNIAYEKDNPALKEYLLKDKSDLYTLLSATKFKVYCITYTWEFEKIKQEYPRRLYLLGRAGKYVLFVNQMRPQLME